MIDKHNIIIVILVVFILYICVTMVRNSDTFNLKCVISNIDGNEYCVRDREITNEAADLLATTMTKCNKLVGYLNEIDPDHDITKRLNNGYNPKKVKETLPTSKHTAFSENKGEKLAFCLSKKKGDDSKLIDHNTLLFIALHELSHIATVSIGHTEEYWANFKKLLKHAKNAGIYKPVDYKKYPKAYCGMTINDNPYFDK